jgi:nitrate reductase cytochrome c-type subunit
MNARTLTAAALASLLAACGAPKAMGPAPTPPSVAAPATPSLPPPPPEPPGTKDTDLGLAKVSVFTTFVPPAVTADRSEPGEKPVLPRAFPGAPPVPPHELVDYTPITPKQNSCLDCHQIPGPKEAGQPTPIPASHYVDLRRAPDKVGKTVAGARWICTACHVSRTDQPPLVSNPGP